MPDKMRVVSPGKSSNTVRAESGETLTVPAGWALLPPGDAGLTRRVKSGGATWTVKAKRGRRVISLGVWAPADRIEAAKAAVEATRSTDAYKKKLAASRDRRAAKQVEYVEDFRRAVLDFLDFHVRHVALAVTMAEAIAAHATPVGSGTVARTERIPIEQRAQAAVIAWMRHQTTAYDDMSIPRVKGRRREVRRMLAGRSRQLLERYRRGEPADETCPLKRAIEGV